MTKVRAWLTLSTLVAAAGSLTVSCGSDEVTKPPGGLVNSGGSTAAGGSTGAGGKVASGGSNTTTNDKLGQACMIDNNCSNANLSCQSDPTIPNGLCSSTCETDADCDKIASGSLCGGGNGTNSGICLEPCAVGDSLTAKCHGRDDMACRLLDATDTQTVCTSDDNCPTGAVCSQGTCVQLYIACMPTCGSDDDCNGGHCNLRTGGCDSTPLTGKPIGSPCTKDTDCAGICVGTGNGSVCSGYCNLSSLTSCGWNGSGKADAACWWVPGYNTNAGAGDGGFCGQLCDCSSDCLNPTDSCVSFLDIKSGDQLVTLWGRQGYCAPAATGDTVLSSCPVPGEGGAGAGGDSGTAGESNAAGAGGSSNGGSAGAPSTTGGSSNGGSSSGGASSTESAGAGGA